jgi:hypothetical protein
LAEPDEGLPQNSGASCKLQRELGSREEIDEATVSLVGTWNTADTSGRFSVSGLLIEERVD